MYTITIFPQARLTDGSQADKGRNGPLATIGELCPFNSFEEVLETASNNTVSLNEYSASDRCAPGQVHRHGNYFLRTNLIGLDVDDNLSLEAALAKLQELGYRFGLYTSFNHKPDGPHKFRVVLELDGYISDASTFRATWESLHASFLGIDRSCKDVARFYFYSNPETRQTIYRDGKLVPIVTAVPKAVPKFAAVQAYGSFESVAVKRKIPIEAQRWLSGIDEYGNPHPIADGERSGSFYKIVKLCVERHHPIEWCDEILGKRLRADPEYLQKYGGLEGVNAKIEATLKQIRDGECRHGAPTPYGLRELSDPRRFVYAWINSRGLTVARNGVLKKGADSLLPRNALNSIFLDYDAYAKEFRVEQASLSKEEQTKLPRVSHNLLEAALGEYIEENKLRYVSELQGKIRHNGDSSLSELKKFVQAICGGEDPVTEAILAHFVWQVKRKVFGLEVQYHLMPIFTGPQGNGKSTAIKRLYKPLIDFVATPTFADLADKRHFEAFESNFIAFCDELEKADQADVDGLKNFITADRLTARILYSTTMAEFRQNCTAIGCTNKSLATLIYDPTGMRRFFEINTDPNMKQNGWNLLDEIDFELLWKQVDEGIPGPECYIQRLKGEIETRQEQLRTADPIESFIEETGAVIGADGATKPVKKGDFYDDYRFFCNSNGHKPRQSTWFAQELARYGIEKSRRTVNGKLEYVFLVGAEYAGLSSVK